MGVKDTANLAMIPAAYAEDKVYSVLPSDGDGDFTFTRTGSGTRINKGGYIETMGNNVPRLNYRLDADGNVSECAELLLEESRTNQFTNSENLANIDYQNFTTIAPNNTIAPSGSLTADKTTQTSGGYLRETVSVSNGTKYSFYVFLKKGDLRYAVIRSLFSQNGTTPVNSNNVFDLDNGSVVYKGTDIVSANIEAYPNNWYRCSFVSTASATGSAPFVDFYFSSSSSGTQSSGTAGFGYGWGMQLEAGSTVSSYIPTGASQVTRNKDEAEINNFADAPTDYPFTMYVQMRIETGVKGFGMAFGWDATSDRYYSIGYSEASSNKKFRFTNRSQGTGYDFEPSAEYYEGLHKVAVKFISSTNFKAYINGIEVANHTHTASAFNSSIQDLLLGQLREVSDTNSRNPIKDAFMWNKALTDAEMVDVTSYDTFAEMANDQQFTIQ